MAEQGLGEQQGPREPTWWIKRNGLGEGIFEKCPQCGQDLKEPSYKVIRVTDAAFDAWHRIDTRGKLYRGEIALALLGMVAMFVVTLIASIFLTVDMVPRVAYLLRFIACVITTSAVYFGAVRVFLQRRYETLAIRQEAKAEFLEGYGEMEPKQVGTPTDIGRRNLEYILVPGGVMNEIRYEEWED